MGHSVAPKPILTDRQGQIVQVLWEAHVSGTRASLPRIAATLQPPCSRDRVRQHLKRLKQLGWLAQEAPRAPYVPTAPPPQHTALPCSRATISHAMPPRIAVHYVVR